MPGIGDVGHDEGNQEGYPEHDLERKLARGAVANREGTLQVGAGRVVGRTVVAGDEEDGHHDQDRADAGGPDTASGLLEGALENAPEYQQHAEEEHHQDGGHLQEVMQVLEFLHRDDPVLVRGKAGAYQQDEQPAQEEGQERYEAHFDRAAHLGLDCVVIHVVEDVECTEDGGQEHQRAAEQQRVVVDQGLEPVPAVAPGADDRGGGVGDRYLIDGEVAAGEEGADGGTDEQGSEDTVDHQEDAEGFAADQVFLLVLELIGNGLEDEGEQDQDPHPVGAAEAGAVEQREGGEEGTAEGDECREGQLPFAAGGIEDHPLLEIAQRTVAQVEIGSLDEHQEDEQTAQ